MVKMGRLTFGPDFVKMDFNSLTKAKLAEVQGCGVDDKEWTCVFARSRKEPWKWSLNNKLPDNHERHQFDNKLWTYVEGSWPEPGKAKRLKQSNTNGSSKGKASGSGKGGRNGRGRGRGRGGSSKKSSN